MPPNVVVDTGPIVASLDADEVNHAWAVNRLEELRPPLLTCEAVLTEASYLVARAGARPSVVVDLVARGMLAVVNVLEQEANAVSRLMRRYAKVPMSLADACLVRIAERTANATVLTLDSDFGIYRQKGRRLIPLITPDN
ncbi:MAG TPA: PIN domain-containing protein [Woeseiaceae bacterium]|nr:PIN domain-containing protein [Woeseiaceae bacterium]